MADHPAPSHTGHAHVEHVGKDAHVSHGVGHVVSPKILLATAAALLALTFITVAAAKVDFASLEMPELNVFVALGIAVVKASLVCLFFMHLRWDRPFNGFLIVGSVALVALFIIFAMTDSAEYRPDIEAYRGTLVNGESAEIQAEVGKLPPPLTEEQLKMAESQTTPGH
jgi:cytochrome c oxidase subunit 4